MKILVVKLSSLGDIVHLFPAVSDLRRHFPDAQIHWLVEPAFAEAVGWHSAVNEVTTVSLRANKKSWWKIPVLLVRLRRQLQTQKYDIVLDAQGLLKSALLSRLAGAPVLGFDARTVRESPAAWLYQKTVNVPGGLHVVEKNRRLIAGLFAADIMPPADFGVDKFRCEWKLAQIPDVLKKITDQPYVVLLHGTTWSSKHWPEPSWLELIHMFSQRGLCSLLPWGNEAERQRALRLQAAGGKHTQVLPRVSLTDLMKVLVHAHAFVSVESGIGHLATILGISGVMLHGPTSPNYSGISSNTCRHLTSGIACSPCFKRDCPILNDAGIPPCQLAITPQQVYQQCLL